MNEITTVGVDLAKEVIVVCAGDAGGRTVYFRQFSFYGFGQWAATCRRAPLGWRHAAQRITGRAD